MYKDYMSLEMASFIIKALSVGSEKLFYYPQPLAGPGEAVAPAIERKTTNTKHFIEMMQRTIACTSIYTSCEVKNIHLN